MQYWSILVNRIIHTKQAYRSVLDMFKVQSIWVFIDTSNDVLQAGSYWQCLEQDWPWRQKEALETLAPVLLRGLDVYRRLTGVHRSVDTTDVLIGRCRTSETTRASSSKTSTVWSIRSGCELNIHLYRPTVWVKKIPPPEDLWQFFQNG